MSYMLRILLVVISSLTFLYVFRKVRKEQIKIEHTIFWIFISLLLVVLSAFPRIAYWATDLLGIMAPVNFIFITIIFVLFIKIFWQSIKISQLETKIEQIVQVIAINQKENEEGNE